MSRFYRTAAILLLSLLSLHVAAAERKSPSSPTAKSVKSAKAKMKPTAETSPAQDQALKVVYGSSTWNVDSTKSDSAFLFLRDRKSGKIVKVRLDETEPDSSLFTGNFAVNLGAGGVSPEIFIPPKDLRDNEEAIKKFNQLLSSGQVQSKPLLTKEQDGRRVIEVFDTPAQAKQAARAYEDELKARKKEESLVKPVPKTQDLEVAEKSAQRRLLDKLAIETAEHEAQRVRLEQIERQKVAERERQARELDQKQREGRKRQASVLAQEGNALFLKGEFPAAEEKFRKAVELDPETKGYYFYYGVTLYRNDKFNDALVVFKIAPDEPSNLLDKQYYMALTYYRLKEYDSALNMLRQISSHTESPLAASAVFYEGVVLMTQEDYEPAKEAFERVIDISNDPALDRQAEEYIDGLVALMQQKIEMSKRFFMNATTGLMYDSNVLLAPDSDTTQAATKEADTRLSLVGDIEYRPLYTPVHELGGKASVYYMRSQKEEVSLADPFVLNLGVPYTYKGMAFGKGLRMGLKPAYEMTYMDLDQDGSREDILNSMILSFDNTFVMEKNWFSTYSLEVRQDDSLTELTSASADADAMKISVKTVQTYLIDAKGKEVIMGNAGYIVNNAKGNDKYYARYEIGVNYVRPTSWDAAWNMGLSYYFIDYSKEADHRKDNDITLTSGLTKPVREWVSWNVTGSYISNTSTTSASQYSKYSITAAAIFNYSL